MIDNQEDRAIASHRSGAPSGAEPQGSRAKPPAAIADAHMIDMANVGEALMEAIRDYSSAEFMKSWHPADCPSEIVGDLLNALEETQASEAELLEALRWLRAWWKPGSNHDTDEVQLGLAAADAAIAKAEGRS